MRKELLFIFSIILLQGCNSGKLDEEFRLWENAKSSNKIESFLNFIYEYPHTSKIDSSILYLDKLIKNDPLFQCVSVLAVDSANKRIGIEFVNLSEFDYNLKKRNSYQLTITEIGVIHNNTKINSSTYKNEIEKLITDPIFGEDQPQTAVKQVKYFGDIVIVKLCVVIDTDFKKTNSETKKIGKNILNQLLQLRIYLNIFGMKKP